MTTNNATVWITFNRAASLLGTTTSVIQNYVSERVLLPRKIDYVWMLDANAVMALRRNRRAAKQGVKP